MRRLIKAFEILNTVILGNLYFLWEQFTWNRTIFFLLTGCILGGYLVIHIEPVFERYDKFRLHVLMGGERLLSIVWISSVCHILLNIVLLWTGLLSVNRWFVLNAVAWFLAESLLMCNGALRIFCLSGQLTLKFRILLWFVWLVPVVNIPFLLHLQHVAREEIEFELEKAELDDMRAENECCKTRYPILLVHGVFFRDMRFFNYWGRIPKELVRNGATIFYGKQQSAASVADSALELKERIRQIIEETNCGKVNIIAHSKGGLDSRYAISCLGMAPYVASLTTINTPHYGCAFADYLLSKIPKRICDFVANRYNKTLKRLGDFNPDFIGAVKDLTVEGTSRINQLALNSPQVVYHSYSSVMKGYYSAPFPQSLTYLLSYHFSHDNDGLVDADSAAWTSDYQVLQCKGRRGISHGDMIDLYRKNIKGFDVLEFYVGVVERLKKEGL